MPWDPFHTVQQGEQDESDRTGLSKPLRLTGEENMEKTPPFLNQFIQAHQEETRKSMNCMSPLYLAYGIFLPRIHPFIQKLFEVILLHARPCEHQDATE